MQTQTSAPTKRFKNVRAAYLQRKLCAQVEVRPQISRPCPKVKEDEPSLARVSVEVSYRKMCVALRDPQLVSAFNEIANQPEFGILSGALKRGLMNGIANHGSLEALRLGLGLIPALASDALSPSIKRTLLEGFGDRCALGLAVLAGSRFFLELEPSAQARMIDYALGPRASAHAWGQHQRTLDRWWDHTSVELAELVQRYAQAQSSARLTLSSFMHLPQMPVYMLTCAKSPGALILCLGEPSEGCLSYTRRFFLDEANRLRVHLRCHAMTMEDGLNKSDVRASWRYSKAMVSRAEQRALIRWVEENHIISGPGAPHEPAQSRQAVYENLVQLDVRLPKMLAMFASNRGTLDFETGYTTLAK